MGWIIQPIERGYIMKKFLKKIIIIIGIVFFIYALGKVGYSDMQYEIQCCENY